MNILIKAHAYWIREADVDGFRVDAVKHMGPVACSRFCSNIREYAYTLGKRGFFLFGEVAQADDDVYNRYIGQNTSPSTATGRFSSGSILFSISASRRAPGTVRCVMCSRAFKVRKPCSIASKRSGNGL